ncbi:MAG: GNAT family N-acetyltransferase [Bacilli bacterium]|nr:GNAT family N-acetyltransferase [Bacilli bacterium]
MKIVILNQNEITEKEKDYLIDTEWGANQFLHKIINEKSVESYLGDEPQFLFLCNDDDDIIGNATLTYQDCVQDTTLFPWIGFIFIKENYRGHRYCGHLIDYACALAREKYQAHRVHAATDHKNFLEKFGFEHIDNRIDFWKEEVKVYIKNFK